MNNMGTFIAYQIILQKLRYDKMIKKYPKYKDMIDDIIKKYGWKINKKGDCVPINAED